MSLFAEIKRRNVIRMAGLYLVGAWLMVQVAGTVLPMFGAPDWLPRSIVILLAIGLVPALGFAWVFELTPDGIKRDALIHPSESIAPHTAQRMNRMIIAVLALAIVYFGFDKFVLAPRHEAAIQAAAEQAADARVAAKDAAKAAAAVPAKSIAVLPLANASGDQDQVYFSDGLSEDLINALSQIDGLKVIGRNSSFQFRDSTDNAQTIGATLGVAHLLEGSVRHAGDTVRITAQLINAADGSTLWSQHYDRPFKDLFALQDEITRAVAGALKAELLPGASTAKQGFRPASGNLAAYTAFLQAIQYSRVASDEAGYLKVSDALTAAIRLDPDYAQAYAGLSVTWMNRSRFRTGTAKQEAITQARAAVRNALALAPESAVVHNALGALHHFADRDWPGAEAEYRRAVQLDPGYAAAQGNLATLLMTMGRPSQAVELLRQSLAIEPLRPVAYDGLATALIALGRLDEAERAAHRIRELQPTWAPQMHVQLATIEILRGNARSALTHARQAPESEGTRDANVALALQIGDDRAAADAALKARIDTQADILTYPIAEIYALRKDPDNMFLWLDHALANADTALERLLYDPLLAPYRHDPRFAALARKLGLPMPGAAAPATSATAAAVVKSAP